MPIIHVDCPQLSKEKKKALVEKLTQVSKEVMEIPEQAFTIIIHENGPDNVGVGGKLLSEMKK